MTARNSANILVVEDDDALRQVLSEELSRRGYRAIGSARVEEALELLRKEAFSVAVLDIRLPDGDGMELLERIRKDWPETEVVMLTGHGTVDSAVQAMKAGAFDYLRKPCSADELEVVVSRALERRSLLDENRRLRAGLSAPGQGGRLVGRHPSFVETLRVADKVAPLDTTVLLLGETGVGKDALARYIHQKSGRAKGPFVVVECALLQENLLESELFGHEKGAFTGATGAKPGLFEVADGGTIFLDEIGEVPLSTQVKLLRVIETGNFRRVGGTEERTTNTRIIAATNRDLQQMVQKGFFRQDLFYRLNAIRIEIPPLRARGEDVLLIAEHFLEAICSRFEATKRFSEETKRLLAAYDWPGNVRQLQHAVERAVILSESDTIEPRDLPPEIGGTGGSRDSAPLTLEEIERRHILDVLGRCGGNRARAAELLGISERTLYRKLKQWGPL